MEFICLDFSPVKNIVRNYSLLQATLGLGGSGRQVFYPCALCTSETFRWQFDLYKHYATQHFYDELASQVQLEGGPPYKCHLCTVTQGTEKQMLIHYGLTHKALQGILQKKLGSGGGGAVGGDRSVRHSSSSPHVNCGDLTPRAPGVRNSLTSLQPSNYKCPICLALLPAKHKSDHLTVHFKDKISPLLAKDVPFTCPKCRYVAMDRPSLIRHFATRHGLVDAFLKVREGKTVVQRIFIFHENYFQDWLERHDRLAEAEAMECVDLPEIKPPPEKDQLECRLCEDFPVFNKNFDFHKHLADIHFRTQLNNDLPQVRANHMERECFSDVGNIAGRSIQMSSGWMSV